MKAIDIIWKDKEKDLPNEVEIPEEIVDEMWEEEEFAPVLKYLEKEYGTEAFDFLIEDGLIYDSLESYTYSPYWDELEYATKIDWNDGKAETLLENNDIELFKTGHSWDFVATISNKTDHDINIVFEGGVSKDILGDEEEERTLSLKPKDWIGLFGGLNDKARIDAILSDNYSIVDKEKDKGLDNLEAIQNEIKPAQKNGKAREEVK